MIQWRGNYPDPLVNSGKAVNYHPADNPVETCEVSQNVATPGTWGTASFVLFWQACGSRNSLHPPEIGKGTAE